MGEAAKPLLFEVVEVSKLEEVSHEMLLVRLLHVSKCQNWRKSRTKCSFSRSHMCNLEFLIFQRLRSMGEATKPLLFEVVEVSKLEEVSHELLLVRLLHV